MKTMKSAKNNRGERGQALVELCTGIIGILTLFVAVLFVAGICVANIKSLQSGKNNVESLVLDGNSVVSMRRDISTPYPGKDGIPFTIDDQISYYGFDVELEPYFSSEIYSQSTAENADYLFKSINDTEMRSTRDYETNFFTGQMGTYAAAANLVTGVPDSYDSLYTYHKQKAEDRRSFSRAVSKWLGISQASFNVSLQRVNQVYMPRVGRHDRTSISLPDGTGD